MKKLLIALLALFILVGCNNETPKPVETEVKGSKPIVTRPTNIPAESEFINAKDNTTITDIAKELLMIIKDGDSTALKSEHSIFFEMPKSTLNANGSLSYILNLMSGNVFMISVDGGCNINGTTYKANNYNFAFDPAGDPVYLSGSLNMDGVIYTDQNVMATFEAIMNLATNVESNMLVNHTAVGPNYVYTNTNLVNVEDIICKVDIVVETKEHTLKYGFIKEDDKTGGFVQTGFYFCLDNVYYDKETWDVAFIAAGEPEIDLI